MTPDPLLQLLTRVVFLAIFGLAVVDLARRRDLPRLEIALLFGSLAPSILLQLVDDFGWVAPGWLTLGSVLAVLAQPYLLVRLLGHFQPVPRVQHAVALVCLLGSWALALTAGAQLSSWAVLAVAGAFALVEGFACLSFVRAAASTRGLAHRRLVSVAMGSGCLAAVMLMAGARATLPSISPVATPLSDLLALGSAVGFYLGFAPPRWLRRTWQRIDVERFLTGLAGTSSTDRMAAALDYLGPAAARATGGRWAVVALASPGSQELRLHPDPVSRAAIEKTGITSLPLERAAPALVQAWRGDQPLATTDPSAWGEPLRRLAESTGPARGALIAPLAASGRVYGLFVVIAGRASPFLDDDLAVLSVLAEQAALAIESRRLTDENVRERTTLTAVMESMHDGLVVTDASCVVRYCNARAEAILDLPSGALLGRRLEEAIGQIGDRMVDQSEVREGWSAALANADERPSLEMSLTGSPGCDVLVQVFPVVDPGGQRRGVGVVLRDVTAERDLARTKDELVSVVSHELRTPLASVVGFAELLRARELDDAQRQTFLTVIVEEGRRLTSMINDFLDLQRMESGRQEISPRALALRPLLEQAIALAGEDPTRPIHLSVSPSLPLVRVDADRVLQVLTNLLSNARKYSPRGGTVEVRASETEGQVTVAVQDHGLGIPREAQARLFEKFYRVDNSDRRQIKGTGLGLTISQRIVEAHGGRIWAESEGAGHGSRFSFTLPLSVGPRRTGDVLVVEDDAGFARLLAAELADRGLSSAWAASVEDALEQVAAHRPRAVMLDLLLPGADGDVFLRRLRTSGGADIPVVVVTVKDLTAMERRTFEELGVVAVLRKGAGVATAASDALANALGGQSRAAA